MKKKRLGIIGSGNMAHFLGRRLEHSDLPIDAIHSRNREQGKALAQRINAAYRDSIQELEQTADVIFLCVQDDQIASVASSLSTDKDKMIVHHSGTQSLEKIRHYFPKAGIFWPVYAINKTQIAGHRNIPVIISSEDTQVQSFLIRLAEEITNLYQVMPEEKRETLHLMAVMSSNFMNHLATITREFGMEKAVPFEWVLPIIQQTVERMNAGDTAALQTGPAVRNDQLTMKQHMQMLHAHPIWQEIYRSVSQSIIEFYKK